MLLIPRLLGTFVSGSGRWWSADGLMGILGCFGKIYVQFRREAICHITHSEGTANIRSLGPKQIAIKDGDLRLRDQNNQPLSNQGVKRKVFANKYRIFRNGTVNHYITWSHSHVGSKSARRNSSRDCRLPSFRPYFVVRWQRQTSSIVLCHPNGL